MVFKMSKMSYKKLEKVIINLKEQYNNHKSNKKYLSRIDKDGIKESVIKRFEICNDILWKYLKKYLQEKEGVVDVPNSPNGVFRVATDVSIIDTAMLDRLMDYNQLRGKVVHDYSQIKAEEVFKKIGSFIKDADVVYNIISK